MQSSSRTGLLRSPSRPSAPGVAQTLAITLSILASCTPHRESPSQRSERGENAPTPATLVSQPAAVTSAQNAEAPRNPTVQPATGTLSSPAASAPSESIGCPAGMLRVSGSYCPSVAQTCLEYHSEYVNNPHSPTVSDRCLRYAEPSHCMSERRPLDFCMDRFEFPNRLGEKPRVLTSWTDASALCEAQGKRLCTEDEFNFACEGPDMLPYATGYERDSNKCNFDREYLRPDLSRRMKTYDDCAQDPWCSSEMARLDQRHAIGSRLSCVSFAGVVDLNGNVNEWVAIPGAKAPTRSGLKGGWWGPVRDRCRPTVRFHKENDYGYEAGFRCCAGKSDRASANAP